MLQGQRIFLTGGAGFIGTALVRRLAQHNQCIVFDLLRRNALAAAGLAGVAPPALGWPAFAAAWTGVAVLLMGELAGRGAPTGGTRVA